MKRTALLAVIAACLALAPPAASLADGHDEGVVKEQVKKMWKSVAAKKYDGDMIHPDGAMQATSAGGFWRYVSREEQVAQINEDPTTLDFTPYYIDVRLLGSNEDVAHVTFYLSGTIYTQGAPPITNYRTRASLVMEKVDGKWVTAGAHYSPLFGGSGVLPD